MVEPFDIGITVSKTTPFNGTDLAQYLLDSLNAAYDYSVVCNERSNVFESATEDIFSLIANSTIIRSWF